MKHFNTLPEGKSDSQLLPGNKSDYEYRHFKKEHLPVIFLISVGLIGTFYLFNVGFGNKLKASANKITRHQIFNDNSKNTVKPLGTKEVLHGTISIPTIKEDQLKIEGEKEAKQLLNFSIKNFDKKAKYDLLLGDGIVLHPKTKSIEYAYQRPGRFRVELIVTYEGKSAQLFSKIIQISKPIQIAPGAHREN